MSTDEVAEGNFAFNEGERAAREHIFGEFERDPYILQSLLLRIREQQQQMRMNNNRMRSPQSAPRCLRLETLEDHDSLP